MKKYSELEIDIMIGLDDMAHNRCYTMENGKFIRISNYGKRNYEEKCYCSILRKLGVRR